MHPAVEAGLIYWRTINQFGKDYARIVIQFHENKPPDVIVSVGEIYAVTGKQQPIVQRHFHIVDSGGVGWYEIVNG